MTKENVKKYYTFFSYINLILSIVFIIVSTKSGFFERVMAALVINIFYHILYSFFSSINQESRNSQTNIKFINFFARNMMKVFSLFGILCSFFIFFIIIFIAIPYENSAFLFLCLPIGTLFGAYSLWLDSKKKLKH